MENWKDVVGYEGDYEVSDRGKIYSYLSDRELKPTFDGKYFRVGLRRRGKSKIAYVHRLVLEVFSGPCPEGYEAGHLNGNSKDNRADNLRWITHKENMNHKKEHGTEKIGERSRFSKLKEWQVLEIRRDLALGRARKVVAKKFQVSLTCIKLIANDVTWRHLK